MSRRHNSTKREVPSPRRRYDDRDARSDRRSPRDDGRDRRDRGRGGATKTSVTRGRDDDKAAATKRAADTERQRDHVRGASRAVRVPVQPGASRSRYALPVDLDERLETRASFMPLHRAPAAHGTSAPAAIQTGQGDVHIYDRCTVAAPSNGGAATRGGPAVTAQQQTLVTLLTLALQSRGVGVKLGGSLGGGAATLGSGATTAQRQWFDGDASEFREGDLIELAVPVSAAATTKKAGAKKGRRKKKLPPPPDDERVAARAVDGDDAAPPTQWDAGFIDAVNRDGTYDIVLRAGGRVESAAASDIRLRAGAASPATGGGGRSGGGEGEWATVRAAQRAGATARDTLAATAPARATRGGAKGASSRRAAADSSAMLSPSAAAEAKSSLANANASGASGDGGEAITVEHREGMADGSLRWYSSGILTAEEALIIEAETRAPSPSLSPLPSADDTDGSVNSLSGKRRGKRRARKPKRGAAGRGRGRGRGRGAARGARRRGGDGESSSDDASRSYGEDGAARRRSGTRRTARRPRRSRDGDSASDSDSNNGGARRRSGKRSTARRQRRLRDGDSAGASASDSGDGGARSDDSARSARRR